MAEYINIGKGRLYQNNFKVSEKQPDYKGEIVINGHSLSIAGWNNGTYIGLTITNGIGKLFKNDNNDRNYPNYSGKINKGSSTYYIAGWNDGSSIGLKLSSK